MRSRSSRHVAEVGQVRSRKHVRPVLLLSVPVLSLVVPAIAVDIASAGGSSLLTRSAHDVARFLLFYSGVFALVALTAAVAAGLLATDRIVMSPERRIVAQSVHRTTSLIGISALANHIELEVLAQRARIADSFIPFMASRHTFFMGLGTVSSDLFIVIIVTGVLRRRFTSGGARQLWRVLHATAYAAWPMAILHSLLAGRTAKPYVDWSYGACVAAVAMALIIRSVATLRGKNAAPVLAHRRAPVRPAPPAAPAASAGYQALPAAPGYHAAAYPAAPSYPAVPSYPAAPSYQARPFAGPPRPLRALPSGRSEMRAADWAPDDVTDPGGTRADGHWTPDAESTADAEWSPDSEREPDSAWAPATAWIRVEGWGGGEH